MSELSPIIRESRAPIPTDHGEFQLTLYRDREGGEEHLAVVHGELGDGRDVLLRIHSECFTGDVLGSLRCDCGDQLDASLRRIVEAGSGVVLYLRQEGRGIGLAEKLRAYNLQDLGYDTVDANRLLGHAADGRDYSVAVAILRDLGVSSVHLLSNNPAKVAGLEAGGIEVVERVPLAGRVTTENLSYLRTKVRRMEHLLDLGLSAPVDGNGSAAAGRTAPVPPPAADYFGPVIDDLPADRPFVTLSYAQSLDGSIAAEVGQPLSLSGAESMTLTHRLRAVHQGILVGIGTVLADDPQLTVRLVRDAEDPVPVVLDGELRTPTDARLFAGSRRPWIVAAESADPARERRLIEAGAQVLRLPVGEDGLLPLATLLASLRERGVESLMVEGGAQVITSFLAQHLVDHLVITLAPTLVGGVHAVRSLTAEGNGSFPRLEALRHRRLGDDLILSGRPHWNGG